MDSIPYTGCDEVEHQVLYVSLAFRMRKSRAHFLEVFNGALTALPPTPRLIVRTCVAGLLSTGTGLDSIPYPECDEVEDQALYVSLAFCMREPRAHFLNVLSEVLTAHAEPPRTNLLGGTALGGATTLVWIPFHIQGVTRSSIEPSASPSHSKCVRLQLPS